MRAPSIALLMIVAAVSAQAQAPRSATMETDPRPAVIQRATNTEALAPLDGNPTLFAVLAAVNAAGYDTEIDSPSNNPLRQALRDHLAKQTIPSLFELRRFVRDHRLLNASDDLGQYISFALLSKGAPTFGPAMSNFPRPADVENLRDFAPLLAAFYEQAHVDELWQASQPAYDAALAPYTDPVSRTVQSVNAYFRNPGQQTKGRFQIFIDLLGAPNQVHARIYLEEYFVVITPSVEPRTDEIRHQYLRFWADGLRFKYPAELSRLKPLGDFALASPILNEVYRQDFLELATESLVRALDARIMRQPTSPAQAMREGFVLAPAFYDLLPKYETQPDTLRNYFADLVKGVDVRKEAARLDKIDFVTERQVRTVRVVVQSKPPVLTGTAKLLEEAEELFRAQRFPDARQAWSAILAGTAEKPSQARAYYGLGRVSLAGRDPERADQLFRKVLELDPDASTLSWTLLYLGKLADSQGDAEPAKQFYSRALAVSGVPEQVAKDARQGLTGAFVRSRPPEVPDAPTDDEDEEDEL